jgi:hypothetical protein
MAGRRDELAQERAISAAPRRAAARDRGRRIDPHAAGQELAQAEAALAGADAAPRPPTRR